MMNHGITILLLFSFCFLGIVAGALYIMNNINKSNEDYTFKIVWRLFWKREWPSYGFSIVVDIVYSLTHDEWVLLINKHYADSLLADVVAIGGVSSFLLGLFLQLGVYKFWFSRLTESISIISWVKSFFKK